MGTPMSDAERKALHDMVQRVGLEQVISAMMPVVHPAHYYALSVTLDLLSYRDQEVEVFIGPKF